MASDALKREFLVEYVHGMGNAFYLFFARSKDEIMQRYPLFIVRGLDEHVNVPPEGIERLRMYPGPCRPRDLAVQERSSAERKRFLAAQQGLWEGAATQLELWGRPGASVSEVSQSQLWIDIDDDMDFRMQMHELWKDDVRYRELPPERRLF